MQGSSERRRSLVLFHPSPAEGAALAAMLPHEYDVLRFDDFETLTDHLQTGSTDAVVAFADGSVSRLLEVVARVAPAAARVLLTDDPNDDKILSALAEGNRFAVVHPSADREVAASLLAAALRPPPRGTRQILQGVSLVASRPGGRELCWPVEDVSHGGLRIWVEAGARLTDLLPGTVLTGLRLEGPVETLAEELEATVRYLKPVHSAGASSSEVTGAFHAGLELGVPGRVGGLRGSTVDDPTRVAALLRDALRTGHVTVQPSDTDTVFEATCRGEFDPLEGCVWLNVPASMGLQPWDIVLVTLLLGGHAYSFHTAVQRMGATTGFNGSARVHVACVVPRSLKVSVRRAATRLPTGTERPVKIGLRLPFGGEAVRTALDITSSGAAFAVLEHEPMPVGVVLPRVELSFPNGDRITLRARVRSLNALSTPVGGPARLRCGIEFVDVPGDVRMRLADAVVQADLPRVFSGVGHRHEELWQFFLDTEFLYPEKLKRLEASLPEIRDTFTRLLDVPTPLLKTLVFKEEGRLLGHISAVKTHRSTWMVQHLAALKDGRVTLASARMLSMGILSYLEHTPDLQWVRIFFRPNNKWPARVMGNFTRRLQDPARCDLRTYGYLAAPTDRPLEVSNEIEVRPATAEDLSVIERHFVARGRTAELQACDLRADTIPLGQVDLEYRERGLFRRREVRVATCAGKRLGFALIELSSLGLNLSEVTNAFSVQLFGDDVRAVAALSEEARTLYAALGRRQFVALAEAPEQPALEALGFVRSKDYSFVTLHRSLVRRYFENVVRLYDRTRPRRAEQGARTSQELT